MKPRHTSVSEYIAAQPAASRAVLRRVRRAIRDAIPDANEVVSYGIPAYKVRGRAVIYFAAWKEHFSLYPASAHVVSALETDLAPYEIRKGTIRFSLSSRVPLRLIGRIARLRAKELAGKEKG